MNVQINIFLQLLILSLTTIRSTSNTRFLYDHIEEVYVENDTVFSLTEPPFTALLPWPKPKGCRQRDRERLLAQWPKI